MASILSYIAKRGVTVRFSDDILELHLKSPDVRGRVLLTSVRDPYAVVYRRLQDALVYHFRDVFPFEVAPATTAGYNMGVSVDDFLERARMLQSAYQHHLDYLEYRVASLEEPISVLLNPKVLPPPEVLKHSLHEEVSGVMVDENTVIALLNKILTTIDHDANTIGSVNVQEGERNVDEVDATTSDPTVKPCQLDTIEEQPFLEDPPKIPTESAATDKQEPPPSIKVTSGGKGASKKGGAQKKKKTMPPESVPAQSLRAFPRELEELKGYFNRYKSGGGKIPTEEASFKISPEVGDTEDDFTRKCAIIYEYFRCGDFRGDDFVVAIESD